MRPAESISAEIRHLPHLFPEHGLERQTSRGDKIQLVKGDPAVLPGGGPAPSVAGRRAGIRDIRRTSWQSLIQ
jgi:hypothetical protein